jgi:hypothetical protein
MRQTTTVDRHEITNVFYDSCPLLTAYVAPLSQQCVTVNLYSPPLLGR